MAWMSDEAYDLKQENREKKITAQSAKNRRGHTGKGGKVRLPSDNLTQKQWEAKNGECKSYRMNAPMKWEQFKEMPDDLKAMYIKAIRAKYHAPDNAIACNMGVNSTTFSKKMRELGIGMGRGAGAKNPKWYKTEDAREFEKWWYKQDDEIPMSGGGKFTSSMGQIIQMLEKWHARLGDRKVRMTVSWEVMED